MPSVLGAEHRRVALCLPLTHGEAKTLWTQMVPSHQESDEYKRRNPDDAVQLRLPSGQVEARAIPVSVKIDCDFYSITPLYQPVATAIRYDVIAVTGLSAHAFGSWKSPDQADRMWLRGFLCLDFPDIRVLTWGYSSSIKDDRSTTSITAISRNFLEDIKRTVVRPLILIGHSLGGLVLQNALVDASKGNSAEDKAFRQSCVSVLFFGVPHQGLNPRSIQSLVQGKGSEHFLQDLSSESEYLFELEKDFKICHKSMKHCIVVSFFESQDTSSVEKTPDGRFERSGAPIRMVPRSSAVCSVSKSDNRIEIRAEHSRMVKFRSQSDEHYQRVIVKIEEMTKDYYHLLLSYIKKYWGHHLRNCPDNIGPTNQQILATLLKFAKSLGNAQKTPPWLSDHERFKPREGLQSSESDIIHSLLYFGLTDHIQYMLENGDVNVDRIYCNGVYDKYTPLMRAAKHEVGEAIDDKAVKVAAIGVEVFETKLLKIKLLRTELWKAKNRTITSLTRFLLAE
ncbi:hypothetical protein FPQ18DRAFT_303326 [Pyronema domesticum]|nr:hypothetical protein FPQ18DRAFT_303326 [Pyronema domesticum]